MNNKLFEQLLIDAGLTKTDFANLVAMNYNSVTNWNKSDKIPQWVESWLKLYKENKDLTKLKQIIKETVCDKQPQRISQLEIALTIGIKSVAFYSNCENNNNNKHFDIEHPAYFDFYNIVIILIPFFIKYFL